jgi:hypothetical protein
MIPSIDVRLAAVIRVLENIALPTLDGLAKEQTALAIGHLRIIRGQQDFAERYEALQFRAARKVGNDLMAILDGGEATQAAGVALRNTLLAPPEMDPSRVRNMLGSTLAAMEALIKAAERDGTEVFRHKAMELILAYGREESLRERSWFGGMGFEPGAVTPLPQLMAEFETQYGAEA